MRSSSSSKSQMNGGLGLSKITAILRPWIRWAMVLLSSSLFDFQCDELCIRVNGVCPLLQWYLDSLYSGFGAINDCIFAACLANFLLFTVYGGHKLVKFSYCYNNIVFGVYKQLLRAYKCERWKTTGETEETEINK